MVNLLVYEELKPESHSAHMFGGVPMVAKDVYLEWPLCETCEGTMQFLGQLTVESPKTNEPSTRLIFMCQNDPGLCDEWESSGGGNKVVVSPLVKNAADSRAIEAPDNPEAVRPFKYAASSESAPADGYDNARTEWSTKSGKSRTMVLGQLYGAPVWLQADETPQCDSCETAMRFIAQLEEGPSLPDKTEADSLMNFGGGGCAYVFDCPNDCGEAKMLWQC